MARKRPRVEIEDDDEDDVIVVAENIKRRSGVRDQVAVVSQGITNLSSDFESKNQTKNRSSLVGNTSTNLPQPVSPLAVHPRGQATIDASITTNAPAVAGVVATATFDCGICMESCQRRDGVSLCEAGCVFCRPCVARQLRVSASSRQFPIHCAGCELEIDPWAAVAEIRWQHEGEAVADLLAQMAVQAGMTTIHYCSNEKCSTPYEFEGNPGIKARVVCPVCHVKSCVRCSKPWHDGPCQFNSIPGAENARPCPNCNQLCEVAEGCDAITCHCGTPFCFSCGGRLDDVSPHCGCL